MVAAVVTTPFPSKVSVPHTGERAGRWRAGPYLESGGCVCEGTLEGGVRASFVAVGLRHRRYGQSECGDCGDCESLCHGVAFHDHLLCVHKLPPFVEGDHFERLFSLPPVQAAAEAQKRPRFLVYFLKPTERTGQAIDPRTEEITFLLKAWGGGDEAALARLTEHVYPELRLMARRYMKNEAQGNSLQATALVHEVYLRLVDVTKVEWQARAQFFAMAAQMMRRILVDAARKRGSRRRDGIPSKVNLDESRRLVARARPIHPGCRRGPDSVR